MVGLVVNFSVSLLLAVIMVVGLIAGGASDMMAIGVGGGVAILGGILASRAAR